MGTKERSGLLAVCVRYEEDGGDVEKRGWCAAVGEPYEGVRKQRTACGRHVVYPGPYQLRVPTCQDCVQVLERERVTPPSREVLALSG